MRNMFYVVNMIFYILIELRFYRKLLYKKVKINNGCFIIVWLFLKNINGYFFW